LKPPPSPGCSTSSRPTTDCTACLAAYRTEGRRLAATARAVALVERAMRGEAFAPKL